MALGIMVQGGEQSILGGTAHIKAGNNVNYFDFFAYQIVSTVK